MRNENSLSVELCSVYFGKQINKQIFWKFYLVSRDLVDSKKKLPVEKISECGRSPKIKYENFDKHLILIWKTIFFTGIKSVQKTTTIMENVFALIFCYKHGDVVD